MLIYDFELHLIYIRMRGSSEQTLKKQVLNYLELPPLSTRLTEMNHNMHCHNTAVPHVTTTFSVLSETDSPPVSFLSCVDTEEISLQSDSLRQTANVESVDVGTTTTMDINDGQQQQQPPSVATEEKRLDDPFALEEVY